MMKKTTCCYLSLIIAAQILNVIFCEGGYCAVKKDCRASISELEYRNPSVNYRPLRILHVTPDTSEMVNLKNLGYGGIVTNVRFNDYLQSEANWKILSENVKYAIDKQGLRIWLYDEKGYPSGSAGGLVLKAHPELESQGVAVVCSDVAQGKSVHIEHPRGHKKVIFVKAYKIGEDGNFDFESQIDLSDRLDSVQNLNWIAPVSGGAWRVYYFVRKPFYEGTHATYNWVEKRKNICYLDKRAVNCFIDLTHKEYYKHLGQYFGKGIEAFFNDESALMGTYFTGHIPPGAPPVHDTPDPEFHLLPTLNWSDNFLSEFQARRGYDLIKYLPYMVSSSNEQARGVRVDFYRTISELMAENYFMPLETYCASKGVASSGHLLLEENLYLHPIFEGDLLKMYNHMQYPGIDLLTSHPRVAKEWATAVAKFATSVGAFYGKEHVMSEVSSAFDSEDAGIYGRIASVGVQCAFGIDMFNSYYEHEKMSDTENRLFTDYIARTNYLLGHGKRSAKVALFYPIETAWAYTTPPMGIDPQYFNDDVKRISAALSNTALEMIGGQIDFDYVGSAQISDAKISNGKIIAPSAAEYKLLVIPENTIINESLSKMINDLVKAGVKVLFLNGSEQTKNLYNSSANIFFASDKNLVNVINGIVTPDIRINGGDKDIIAVKRKSPCCDIFIFVNVGDTQKSVTPSLRVGGKHVKVWDPISGQVAKVNTKVTKGEISLPLNLDKWQTLIVSVEK